MGAGVLRSRGAARLDGGGGLRRRRGTRGPVPAGAGGRPATGAGGGVALRDLRQRPAPGAGAVRPPGSVLGHEWAGTVAAVGEDVEGWEVGTPVVADDQRGCGRCRACRRGRPSVCLQRGERDLLGFRGAYCQYVTTAAPRLLRVPDGLSLRTAALTEPTAIALARGAPRRRDARRPGARHGRGSGRAARPRRAAQRRRHRHHRLRAGGGAPAAGPRRRRRDGDHARRPRPGADGAHRGASVHGGVRVLRPGRGGRGRARPARLRRDARVRRHGQRVARA